jgi:hypothetical protein
MMYPIVTELADDAVVQRSIQMRFGVMLSRS